MSNFENTSYLSSLSSQHGSELSIVDFMEYEPIAFAVIKIGKHKTLRALKPFLMLGEIKVVSIPMPEGQFAFTAFTDGWNIYFCKEFLDTLTPAQVAFLVCHEGLHILLKHVFVCQRLWQINAELCGIASDFQVNDWIDILDPNREVVEFIEGALWDKAYRDWSPLQIFKHLQQQQQEAEDSGGTWSPNGEPMDTMDFSGNMGDDESDDDDSNAQQAKQAQHDKAQKMLDKLNDMIAHAKHLIKEGSQEQKKMIDGEMAIKVRWEPLFEDIIMQSQNGADDQTYAIYNTRNVMSDQFIDEDVSVLYPTDYSEQIGEVVMCFDCSGSIRDEMIVFIDQVAEIMMRLRPTKTRVLFWDTSVVSDEIYTPQDYDRFKEMVKPVGGGGTCARCIPIYLEENRINWEACVIFTDGELSPIDNFNTHKPLLWICVTPNGKTSFVPQTGKMVPYIPDEQ